MWPEGRLIMEMVISGTECLFNLRRIGRPDYCFVAGAKKNVKRTFL